MFSVHRLPATCVFSPKNGPVPNLFLLAVCCLGFSAFVTQLTLMRELVSAFSGNELVFGIVLGNWMLLTGIGAAWGRTANRLRSPISVFVVAQAAIALLPIAAVFALRSLRNVVFLRGVEVGVTETVAGCFVLLAPYCLATGYALTVACRIAGDRNDSAGIGRVYLVDNLGNVLGGVAFTFVLVHLFDHFDILYFPALLNLLLAGLLAASAGRRLLAGLAAALAVGVAALATLGNLDDRSRWLEYAGQEVVFHGASPYGNLVVTHSAGQFNFIENGVPLFSTHNVEQVEETVHYAMAQRPQARRVLLISGGVSGTAREVLKYPVEAVDYVELDPLVLDVARQFLPASLADERIGVIESDGRLFVRQTEQQYDVVIVDVPDPSTSQINRFYTREFFAEVRRVLRPGGVVAFSMGTYENYLGKDLARLIAVAQRTLRQVYENVLILPGGRIFFLASDGALTADVARQMEQAGVTGRLVNRNYLKGTFTPDRLADVRRAISADAPINEDFSPILYYYHLRYWMSQFQVRFGLLEAGLLLALAVYMLRLRPTPLAVFCGGFAAAALEVVLLVAFQVLFGSLYYQIGLIVTMFMLGLVIGAGLVNRWLSGWGRRHLMWLAVGIAVFAGILPPLLFALEGGGRPAAGSAPGVCGLPLAIPLLTLVLAMLVGMQFPLAARVDYQDAATTSARLYTADYVGAALGALLVSTWLMPVLGVVGVCLLAAGLNLLAAMVMLVRNG
jgi:spermidine synthase